MSGISTKDGVWGPYDVGFAVHSMALRTTSSAASGASKLLVACSSFIPEAANFVDVLSINLDGPQVVQSAARLPHYYPPTKVRWLGSDGSGQELLATSGDCIRIWSASGELCRLLRHEANPQARCTPITSLDVSADGAGPSSKLASCDVYGICALWDLESGSMQQALDLGQPLCDIAFGPDRLIAVAGERGDCFLLDPRQPDSVAVFAPRQKVCGPARIAWGQRSDLFAVAWQGDMGALALYDGRRNTKAEPRVLSSSSSATTSDLQWSPAFPELLACGKEDGSVEVWQFPEEGLASAALATSPGFRWEPCGREANCTALALSPEVRPGQHLLVLATMPPGQPGPQGQHSAAPSGSLWLAGLPAPSASGRQPGLSSAAGTVGGMSSPSASGTPGSLPPAAEAVARSTTAAASGVFARADAAAGATPSGPSCAAQGSLFAQPFR